MDIEKILREIENSRKKDNPRVFEAVMNDPEVKEHYEKVASQAERNPFFKKFYSLGVKEGLFSDVLGAIGRIHDTVVEAAYPNLISRDIITVIPTKESVERFVKAKGGKAYVMAESGEVFIVGEKYETVDIYTNIEIKAAAEWTEKFLEDATWNVMERQTEALGKAIALKELELVLSLYDAVEASSLAGGSILDGNATAMDWNKITELHDAIINENFSPTVLLLHPRQLSQLLRDDKFINANYKPSGELDVRTGNFGEVLGMRVLASTKCTNGVAYAIDTTTAAVMLVRRDITTKPYEDIIKGAYGVVASERIGLGILQSKAIAKMTNIATNL